MITEVIGAVLPAAILLDAQNLFAPLRNVLTPDYEHPSTDFTIMVPLFGHPRYLRNEAYLSRYKANVLLVINVATPIMAVFADTKESEGWRVARVHATHGTSPADMIIQGLEYVDTTYAIRMDGDVVTTDHPGAAVTAMEAAGADFCSVKVVPTRRHTLAEKLQGVEYDMAMLARHNNPHLTSGACMMGRTDRYRQIMAHHSGYFDGEDIETGRVAKYLRLRVRHIDFAVYTEVPDTFRKLFRQRTNWWCGAFRLSVVNADKNLRFPFFLAYSLGLVYLLLAGKVGASLSAPTTIPTLIVAYLGLTLLANWSVRSRWMVVFPIYALAQAIVMPTVGMLRWMQGAVRSRRLGRYRVPTLATLVPARGRRLTA